MVLSHVATSITARRKIRLRRVALPTAPGHGITRLYHLAGVDRVFRCKRKQQRLVGCEMVEDAEEKSRLARGRANGIGADPGHRQEAAEPLGLAGDETERGNGEIFGRRPLVLTAFRLASIRHRKLRKPRASRAWRPANPRCSRRARAAPPVASIRWGGAKSSPSTQGSHVG